MRLTTSALHKPYCTHVLDAFSTDDDAWRSRFCAARDSVLPLLKLRACSRVAFPSDAPTQLGTANTALSGVEGVSPAGQALAPDFWAFVFQ